MAINLILDKSTFQSLSYDELYRISCYYKHVVTPVLTMEIIGDLKKDVTEGKAPPEKRVKDFANKLFPMETVVNAHYKTLVKQALLGNEVIMDGRPVLSFKKIVQSESCQKGVLIELTQEEKLIYGWKGGNFSITDHGLSTLWRMTTTNEVYVKQLKTAIQTDLNLKLNDFKALENQVNSLITNPNSQQKILVSIIQNYEIDAKTASQIFGRWFQDGNPMIKNFAPYAFHCFKIDLLYILGLSSSLISTRPTNRVDIEYLYYLPFCNIFSSNDNLHKNLVPLLLRSDQKFILGTEIKADMREILTKLETLSIEEKRKFKNKPPINKNSLTYRLWHDYFGYPQQDKGNQELSQEDKEKAIRKMKEYERALDGENIDLESIDEADFIIEKSYLSKNDPCFCGSGKKLIDCCLTEDKFDEIANLEIQKKHKIKEDQ